MTTGVKSATSTQSIAIAVTRMNLIECGEMMSSPIVGNCSSDTNPDAWYPTVQIGGRISSVYRAMVPEMKRAISLCNSCPAQQECLEQGLEPRNLAHGIWGGKLAGERIAMADERGIHYLPPPHNKGRKHGTYMRSRSGVSPTGGNYGGGSAYNEDVNCITLEERAYAVKFAAQIKPYLEESND